MPEKFNSSKTRQGEGPNPTEEEGKPKELISEENSNLFTEGGKEEGKIVENEELGMAYEEWVTNLPPKRQAETGIRRIRRKLLVRIPDDFNLHILEVGARLFANRTTEEEKREFHNAKEKVLRYLYFLTEGEFPSFATVNHQMMADYSDNRLESGAIPKFKRQGLYFQEIFPEHSMDLAMRNRGIGGALDERTFHFFNITKGDVAPSDKAPQTREERRRAPLLYDMSVSRSYESWSSNYTKPIFIFGSKNSAFRQYIEDIISNPETNKMLELMRWRPNEKGFLRILDSNDPEYGKAKDDILQEGEFSIKFLRELCDKEKPAVMKREDANKDTQTIKYIREAILSGRPIWHDYHPIIPVIHHQQIKPLRWCHADCAIIPTQKGLNVLFFETK